MDCDPCSGFPGELVVHVVALEDVNPVKKKYKRFVMMYEGRTSFEQSGRKCGVGSQRTCSHFSGS